MIAPKLRFREFTDEWRAKKLGDFAKTFSGGTPSSSNKSFYVGEIPFIKSGEISTNKTAQAINEEALKTSSAKMVQRGDILYALYGATSGQVAISQINGAINQAVLCIRPEANNYFIYSVLESKKSVILSTYLQGGQGNLSANIIKNLEIKLPSLAEQEKIAKFLTAVDARIDDGARKLELLRNYKTAVSQKIFSREIRFPGFTDEWTSRKLGKISQKMKSGGTPTSTNKSYYDGEIPFLSIADMTEQGKYLTKTTKMITGSGLANSSAWLVPKDSLIYSMYASVGLVAINKIPIATSQAMMDIIPDENFAILEFIYYALDNFRNKVSRYVMTGTQGNLNAGVVKNIEIALPTLPEQQEIANFLSALDDKISQNSRKLSALREFKKMLLQRLFL